LESISQDPEVRKERQSRYFAVGLEHGNGSAGYIVVNTVFLREHNRIARLLKRKYGTGTAHDWDDERIFQTTRNIMIVLLIKIVMEDYIAHIAERKVHLPIGMADKAEWGKPNRISLEFNLLYRWHALIPEGLEFEGELTDNPGYLHNTKFVTDRGIGRLVAAMSRQRAGRLALRNYPDFMFYPNPGNNPLPGDPDGTHRSTVQRTLWIMRQAKLRSLNEYREHFGLKPITSIKELVGKQPGAEDLIRRLTELYGTIDKVEWFVGIFAEEHFKLPNDRVSIMGQTLLWMVGNDAFTQALNNPLLSERLYNEHTFTKEGLEIIYDTQSVRDIARRALGAAEPVCSLTVIP
ncbi:MAG: peroxidase family protein, partial [Pseudomonadota bacterium]